MDINKMDFQQKLKLGVSLILTNWPAIKLVILETESSFKKNQQKLIEEEQSQKMNISKQYKMSNIQVLEDFIISTTQYLIDYDVEEEHLLDFIMDYVEDNFFLILEDQSEQKIVKFIMNLYKDLQNDSLQVLNEYIELSKKLDPNHLYFKQDNLEQEFEHKMKIKDTTPDYDDDGFKIIKK